MKTLTRLASSLLLALLAGCVSTGDVDRDTDPEKRKAEASRANTMLGIEYLRAANFEMSREKLDKALSIDPDNEQAHEAIAILYEKVDEPKLAEKHYRKSLRLAPGNPRVHNNYGQFLCAQERYREAEGAFLRAANDPFYKTPALALTNAGACAMRIPDEELAEKYYRLALERDPLYPPALLRMAELNYNRSNFLSARGYLQRYQEAGQHTAESLWLGIRTEYALDDHQAWGNYAILLKNRYPESIEAEKLQKWENARRSEQ